MPLSRAADLLYRELVKRHGQQPQQVISYSELEQLTGIPCDAMSGLLREIFEGCENHNPPLPPLTAIVVHKGSARRSGQHGDPRNGYWTADSQVKNRSGRDANTNQSIRVDRHQDQVWRFPGPWPPAL